MDSASINSRTRILHSMEDRNETSSEHQMLGGTRQPSNHDRDEDIVTFAPGDPENPRNWSELRKWTIVGIIYIVDLTVSWGASGYSPAQAKFTKEFGVSKEVGVLGLSLYVLGLALGPMSLAPLSEYYGRTPLYVVPYGIFLLFLLGTALVQSLGGFLVLRVLSGMFSGVTIANLGGTIADMWPRHKVSIPVSLWMWAAVGGSPSGFFLMSFVAETHGWRDVFWALLGICGGLWLIMTVILLWGNETRHSVLLRRRAARLRKERNTSRIDVPEQLKERSVANLFKVTLSRPFRFLATEAIIIFAAMYNGYLYGLSFLFNGAYSLVFGEKGYGFTTIQIGLVFLAFFTGVCMGPITNLWQERYYLRKIHADQPSTSTHTTGGAATSTTSSSSPTTTTTKPTSTSATTPPRKNENESDTTYKNIPEARVQLGKIAAVTLPISLWWFAWTCNPAYHIHWIAPVLATSLFGWSFFTLIMMTYIYIEDSYMVFSASALAGVGLVRNLAGAGFPLFGGQLFGNLGYNWAGTVLACLSMLLIPIPYVLERYGVVLRRRSPWARQHMDGYDDGDGNSNEAGEEEEGAE